MNMQFEYTDIKTEGCEGWINLFFGGWCVALIKDVDLAANIKAKTPKMSSVSDEQHEPHDDTCPVCNGGGFHDSQAPCGICGTTGKI